MQVSKYTPSPMWNEKVSIWSGREHIFQMVLVSGDFLKHTVWFSFNGVLQEREKGVHLAWVAAQVSCWDLLLPPSGQRSVGQNNDIITTTATWWKLGRLWWLSQMVRLTVNHGEMRRVTDLLLFVCMTGLPLSIPLPILCLQLQRRNKSLYWESRLRESGNDT